jgi:hypothetical protein
MSNTATFKKKKQTNKLDNQLSTTALFWLQHMFDKQRISSFLSGTPLLVAILFSFHAFEFFAAFPSTLPDISLEI